MARSKHSLSLLLAVLAVAGGLLAYQMLREEAGDGNHGERIDQGAAGHLAGGDDPDSQARDEHLARLEEESGQLMPELLEGVALGMSRAELRAVRRAVQPSLGATDSPLLFLEEQLSHGARVVYGFVRETDHLAQVQIMSVLPGPHAVGPHLTAMVETYGRPGGLYSCPQTGGVPTLRFTWRRSKTGIADIFLVYGNRVSVTLYIAPVETIAASLRRGGCHPVRSEEELESLPVASLEQILESQQEPEAAPPGRPVLRAREP